LSLVTVVAGCAVVPPPPVAPCTPPGGTGFAYVLNSFTTSGVVSMYAVDDCTGALSALSPAQIATGPNPSMVVATPSGNFVYVANAANNTISMYAANPSTGVLTPLTPPTVATGNLPVALAVDSTGFVYATNHNDNTVSMYTINIGTGVLTPMTPPTVATGSGPVFMTVTEGLSVPVVSEGPGFAYVSNQNDDTLSMYTINSTTGVLTPLNPATVPTGSQPLGAALGPGGFLYAANEGGNTVSMYAVNSDGTLTPTGTVATGHEPTSVAVYSNALAYVVNQQENTLSMYSIDASTGNLTPNGNGTIPTGGQPLPVVLEPFSIFAFVVNEIGSVSIYSVNGGGTLTRAGTALTGNGSTWIAVTAPPHPVPASDRESQKAP
jgi:6-phosphogluconolactonase